MWGVLGLMALAFCVLFCPCGRHVSDVARQKAQGLRLGDGDLAQELLELTRQAKLFAAGDTLFKFGVLFGISRKHF